MPLFSLELINETTYSFSLPKLHQTVTRALASLPDHLSCFLVLRFTGDAEIKSLNRKFMGRNSVTDVLTFPVHDFKKGQPPPWVSPNTPLLLGEVVVNLDQAARQAQDAGHSLKREVQFLTEHGVHHLVGFHHK
jgi:probable rRNA maturation factor